MMQKRKITVELPFAFCEDCELVSVESASYYEGLQGITRHRLCEHRGICQNAIDLYQKRMEKGQPWQ